MSVKINEELKPCPFCGGEAELQEVGVSRGSHCIRCMKCWAKSIYLQCNNYKYELTKAWNTRYMEDTPE